MSGTNYALRQEIYRFRDAMEDLGGIAAISIDGDILGVTESFELLFGYAEAEVIGRPMSMLNYIPAMPGFYKNMWEMLRAGKSFASELPCRQKDGQQVMIRISVAPSYGGTDMIIGYIVLYQRAMNLRGDLLSDLFYRYRAGFNRLAAMAVISKDGLVLEINDAFTALFAYQPEEIIGKSISTLRSGDTSQRIYEELWTSVTSGKIWTGEIKNRRKDGSSINVRSTISPAQDHYIHPFDCVANQDAYLVIYQDNEIEIEARNTRVKLAVESTRQEMMAGALHNIGNILQSVVASTDQASLTLTDVRQAIPIAKAHYKTLEAACSAAVGTPKFEAATLERKEFLNQIWGLVEQNLESSQESMTIGCSSVSSSLSVLRSFRQQMRSVRVVTEIRLRDLVQQWLEVFSPQVQRHGVVISVSEMPADDFVVWPLDTVQQIIFNLLKNGKEAVSEQIAKGKIRSGKINLSFSISMCNRVKIEITDTGGGFKIEHGDIFKHGVTTKSYGTGIGLHNAAVMADSLDGDLVAENVFTEGVSGARLTFTLPRVV